MIFQKLTNQVKISAKDGKKFSQFIIKDWTLGKTWGKIQTRWYNISIKDPFMGGDQIGSVDYPPPLVFRLPSFFKLWYIIWRGVIFQNESLPNKILRLLAFFQYYYHHYHPERDLWMPMEIYHDNKKPAKFVDLPSKKNILIAVFIKGKIDRNTVFRW